MDKEKHADCIATVRPVRDALDIISGKWRLPIIISVSVGNERFTDIQNSIPGITPRVLAKELKDLVQNRLVSRSVTAGYPVKITYQPEPYADTLTPVIHALKEWGEKHKERIFGNP